MHASDAWHQPAVAPGMVAALSLTGGLLGHAWWQIAINCKVVTTAYI